MKKVLTAVLISSLLCFSLTGCGSKPSASVSTTTTTPATTTPTTTTTTDTTTPTTTTTTGTTAPTTTTAPAATTTTTTAPTTAATKPATASTTTAAKPTTTSTTTAPTTTTTKPATPTPTTTPTTTSRVTSLTIDQFVSALKAGGFTVTKTALLSDSLIGAKNSVEYNVDGVKLEVYEFDLKSKAPLSASNLKMAKEQGKIKMDLQPGAGANPYITVELHVNLMIANPSLQDPKVLEIFRNLK